MDNELHCIYALVAGMIRFTFNETRFLTKSVISMGPTHIRLMQITHPLTRKGNIMWWHQKMTASDGAKNNMLVNDDINQIIFRAMAGFSIYFKPFSIFLKVSDGNIKLEILGRYMLCEQFVTIFTNVCTNIRDHQYMLLYCRRCK